MTDKTTALPGPEDTSHPEGDDFETYTGVRLRSVAAFAPYLATAIFAMRPVIAPGLGTFAVDASWRVYIDPAKMREWGPDGSAAVLVHEVNHLLRDHATRAGMAVRNGEHRIWNIAGDCEINDDLVGADLPLPSGGVLPTHFGLEDNDLAESYFASLRESLPPVCGTCGGPRVPPGDGGDAQGAGDGSAQGGYSGSGSDSTGSGHSPIASGECPDCGSSVDVYRDCGSGAGGTAAPCELPADSADHPGLDDVQKELIKRKVAQDIKNHQQDKGRGSVPAGLGRWAEDVLQPAQVSWRRMLASAVRRAAAYKAGQTDFTYRKPSRRQNGGDFVFPSMHHPVPNVATVIDTSGSMGDGDVRAAMAEVQGIAKKAGIRGRSHRMFSVDAEASAPAEVYDVRRIKLQGGGGTDMRVGIEAALNLTPKPDVIIVLTDGFSPWPDQPLRGGTRLIIVLIGTEANLASARMRTPEWAQVVEVTTDRASD